MNCEKCWYICEDNIQQCFHQLRKKKSKRHYRYSTSFLHKHRLIEINENEAGIELSHCSYRRCEICRKGLKGEECILGIYYCNRCNIIICKKCIFISKYIKKKRLCKK